ncbi:MAG: helix-turn-helix domain-containing protein [Candidatus Rokubacteria bacterium]|nr:helix-turn-helix domain-containing protein [Candidatus Rokubacteria bacterium]
MLTSLGKALTILDTFAPAAPEWGLSELSAAVGLPKPTVHHMLATLVERGWITQDAKTRRYRLGVRFWEKGWLAWEGDFKIVEEILSATGQKK